MRVLMKKTVDGAPDGAHTQRFLEGKAYDLGGSKRAVELAAVFVREGWAEETELEPTAAPPISIHGTEKPMYRLPLPAEYVARGYQPENYKKFIEAETKAAEEHGFRVEVREMNATERVQRDAEEKADREANAAREAEIERGRIAREAEKARLEAEEKVKEPPAETEMPADVETDLEKSHETATSVPAPDATPPASPKSKSGGHSHGHKKAK